MEFVRVASRTDLPSNKMALVKVGDQQILLANVDGTYFAIANKCTHAGGSLVNGTLEGTCVRCPRHGALFDLRTGRNMEPAKLGFLKIKLRDEDSFPVKVEGEVILVGTERIFEAEW